MIVKNRINTPAPLSFLRNGSWNRFMIINGLYLPSNYFRPPEDPMDVIIPWERWFGRTAGTTFGSLLTNFFMGIDDLLDIRIRIGDIEFLFPGWPYLFKSLFDQTYIEI